MLQRNSEFLLEFSARRRGGKRLRAAQYQTGRVIGIGQPHTVGAERHARASAVERKTEERESLRPIPEGEAMVVGAYRQTIAIWSEGERGHARN